jgi:periplasmic divalent cation tolerance protein
MNTKLYSVYCTFKNLSEAKRIAKIIIEENLAACVNIGKEIFSIYKWQGKIEESKEIPAIFKTTQKQYKHLEKRIKQLHSYDTPCIIAFEIVDGEAKYLEWIRR